MLSFLRNLEIRVFSGVLLALCAAAALFGGGARRGRRRPGGFSGRAFGLGRRAEDEQRARKNADFQIATKRKHGLTSPSS